MPLFTIGADIEFPLYDTIQNKYVSAISLLKSTKYEPEVLENGSLLSKDNVALEFAIPPADNQKEFITYITETLGLVKQHIPKHIVLKTIASIEYEKDELNCDEAWEFGCDPDYNAYREGALNIININKSSPLRSFGGHIHIGAEDKTQWLKIPRHQINFVQLLDRVLGSVEVLLNFNIPSFSRRKLYGKMGSYRTPYHGLEYRVLSNFWVKNKNHIKLIYKLVSDCIKLYNKFNISDNLSQTIPHYYIEEAIYSQYMDKGDHYICADNILYNMTKANLINKSTYNLLKQCVSKKSLREEKLDRYLYDYSN